MRAMHAALGRGFSAFLNCHECYVPIKFSLTNPAILQTGANAGPAQNPQPDRSCPAHAAPRSAMPTTILPRPVRAGSLGHRRSHTLPVRSQWLRRPACSKTRSRCRRRQDRRSLANTAGTQDAARPRPQRLQPLCPIEASQKRSAPAPTLAHPPTGPAVEASRPAGRLVPAPCPDPLGARSRFGPASPVTWGAYNRAGYHPCQNESGASRCF